MNAISRAAIAGSKSPVSEISRGSVKTQFNGPAERQRAHLERSNILVMGRRTQYLLLGWAMGLPILLVLFAIRPPRHWGMAIVPSIGLCNGVGLIVLQKAERRGKVKSIEELHRPLTLFPACPMRLIQRLNENDTVWRVTR